MDNNIIKNIDTDFFADQSDLMAWLGDDPRAYDPLERDCDLDATGDDDDGEALIDDGDVFDTTGDRFPFE